ncbi:ATP-binding protein [Nonomuraea sp. B19D2]|uniref:sensor histidine kinase n=1 Tax=Nonomuraea sp. B19D2 TaxID=3159561 RepID=UPI0032DB1E5C
MRSGALGREGTEHSLMLAFAVLRVGYGVQLAATFAGGRLDWLHPFLAVAAAEATALVVWVARRRTLSPSWIFVADALFVAVAAVAGAPTTGHSWTYPYAFVVVVGAGLALPSALLLLGAIAPLVVAVSASLPPAERPATAVTLPIMAVMSWYVARTLRTYADAVDAAREEAIEAAADLAAQQERAAHTELISERVLRLFDRLGEDDRVVDPRLRAHVTEQAAWLRRYLNGSGGPTTLTEAIARARARGLEVTSDLAESPPLPAATVAALAGAVQEALVNVAKHAGTGHAQVTTRLSEGRLVARVTDKGRGFAPGHRPGFGLAQSIEGRIEGVGGTVAIDSAPGRGTSVEIVLPLSSGMSPEPGTTAGTDATASGHP